MDIAVIIKWVTEHADDVLAIIGTAYVLARAIVALTPTDADDKALANASLIIVAIAAAFGLDIKQGINKTKK